MSYGEQQWAEIFAAYRKRVKIGFMVLYATAAVAYYSIAVTFFRPTIFHYGLLALNVASFLFQQWTLDGVLEREKALYLFKREFDDILERRATPTFRQE